MTTRVVRTSNRYRIIVKGASFGALALIAGCAYFNSPDIKRGDQHLAAGNWEEASLAYKQALKEDPFNSTLQSKYTMARERAAASYEERGRGYLKEHQPDLAAEQFKRALTIEPSSPDHQSGLLEALRLTDARGHNREADRLAQLGRIDEASRYVPLENLAISPQCGFASSLEGNLLTEDEQWQKLQLVTDTARKVWNTT